MRKNLKKILSLSLVFGLLVLAFFYVVLPLLLIRKPWADEKVTAAANTQDWERRQNYEEMYKTVMARAIAKKDAAICNNLPEQMRVYSRDSKGNIHFSSTNTGGPIVATKDFSLVRYQCKLGYAVTFLDKEACTKYADNQIMKYRCYVEVAQEMRLQNFVNFKEVCALIPDQYQDELRECSDTRRMESLKSHFVDKINWEV